MSKVTVEICCGSADDVLQAKAAGADRVELNSSLFLGGLTPTVGELLIAKRTGLPIMCMVRPREGGFCYTKAEFETMLLDAKSLLDAGADGIVFGFLRQDGTLDEERCRRMMQVIGGAQSVFHRAIDVVPDWRAAMDALCSMGVTRILTSGQQPSVHYGMQTVKEMREYAAGRIQILPGAGILLSNVNEVIDKTGCDQLHVAMSKAHIDNSTAGNPSIYFGGALYPPEDRFSMADPDQIRTLVGKVNA